MVLTPDDAKVLKTGIEAATSEALRPFTDLITKLFGPAAEEIGLGLGAAFSGWRLRRQVRFWQKAQELIGQAGFDPVPVPPKLLLPIIQNASIEDDDNLQDRWAALLTNSALGELDFKVFPAFITILKDLSSVEAKLLDLLYNEQEPLRLQKATMVFGMRSIQGFLDEYRKLAGNVSDAENAFAVILGNFLRLNLIEAITYQDVLPERFRSIYGHIQPPGEPLYALTPLGYAFIEACRPPKKQSPKE